VGDDHERWWKPCAVSTRRVSESRTTSREATGNAIPRRLVLVGGVLLAPTLLSCFATAAVAWVIADTE